MTLPKLGLLATSAVVTTSMAFAAEEPMITAEAVASIINNGGVEIGSAEFKQGSRGILMTLSVRDLPPGKHGMHFHSVGDCTPLETFAAGSGHIMPKMLPHGFFHPDGPHAGNLPNLVVAADGTAEIEIYTNMLMLDQGDGKVLDEDGSTLMIHANQDDHFTQPIGGSGGRIGCGIIEAK